MARHLEGAEDAELQRVFTTGHAAHSPPRQVPHKPDQAVLKGTNLIALGRLGRERTWHHERARLVRRGGEADHGSHASSQGAEPSPSSDPGRDRPPTVVVSVRDDGFHWTDAGVGAAAAIATTLLALGLVLALRPDRGVKDNP